MTAATLAPPRREFPQARVRDPETYLKEEGRVLCIDDDPTVLMICKQALSPKTKQTETLMIYGDLVKGSKREEKLESIREIISSFVKQKFADNPPNLIVLDRNLQVGGLHPTNSSNDDDGPNIIPLLKELFPGVKIVGHTGEGGEEGMAEKFGGFVLKKPGYDQLTTTLATAFNYPLSAM